MSLHVINLPETTHSVGPPREERERVERKGEEKGGKERRRLLRKVVWMRVEDSS